MWSSEAGWSSRRPIVASWPSSRTCRDDWAGRPDMTSPYRTRLLEDFDEIGNIQDMPPARWMGHRARWRSDGPLRDQGSGVRGLDWAGLERDQAGICGLDHGRGQCETRAVARLVLRTSYGAGANIAADRNRRKRWPRTRRSATSFRIRSRTSISLKRKYSVHCRKWQRRRSPGAQGGVREAPGRDRRACQPSRTGFRPDRPEAAMKDLRRH